jgi:MFS family permease
LRASTGGGLAGTLVAALVATSGAQALATLAVFVLPVLAPQATREMGVPPHWIGYQVALVYAAAAATSMLAAGALRRFGPARCTQAAVGAAAGACAAFALGGAAEAAFGSVLVGLGYGLTNPAAAQVLSRLAPPARRNMVFAIKQMGVPVGAAAAGFVLPALALALGWRGAVLAVAAVLALAAGALGVFRAAWDAERDPRFPLRAGTGGGMAALRERPGMRGLAAIGALYSSIQLAFGAYAVTMLVEEFGWGPVAAGAAAAATQVVGAAARLLWGAAADRWRGAGGLGVLAAIGLGSTLGALALPLARHWPEGAVVALLCLLGACAAGWNGVLMAEAARLAAPGRAGEAVGGVLAVAFAGVVAGPSLFALVAGALHAYALAFAALATLPLAGAVVAWRTRARLARR